MEVDISTLSKTTRFLLRLHTLLCVAMVYALNKFMKAHHRDYPDPLPKQLFTENSNFIFNQLTCHRYYTIFRRLFFPFRCQSKIIYTNNIAIILEEIKEKASERNIKHAINYINQSTQELRINNHLYKNNRRFAIKLLMDNKVRIHRIIIQNMPNNTISKNNPYFINDNHGIIHILNKEDYYFAINRLLSPVEMHHYLCFRAWLCERKLEALHEISEQSILGQYLIDGKDATPDNHYEKFAKNLDIGLSQWEIILSSLYSVTAGSSNMFEMEYNFILTSIAKLRIDELILFRDKFMLHYANIKKKGADRKTEIDILLPFGFVFIEQVSPDSDQSAYPYHYDAIFKAYCHEHRLKRCIAIIFTPILPQQNKKTSHIRWWISGETQAIDELGSL